MDLCDLIKLEKNDIEIEDNNDNYLQLDFEIGLKTENESTVLEDWCLQNTERYQYAYSDSKVETIQNIEEVSTCSLCLKMFADSYSLYCHNLEHLTVVLPEQKYIFQCDYCQCYYTSKRLLIEHIQIKHSLMIMDQRKPVTLRVQECQICNKTFPYKSWYAHMRTMHMTEKIQCKQCDISFKHIRYLQRHLLYVHGGVKPSWRFRNVPFGHEFICNLCPSVFNNKSSYSTHIRNCHSTAAECTLCHSKLKSKSYLLTHMKRVHYNDGKLHKCDICSKIFRSPRYLNIHKKNSHYVKVKPTKSKNLHTN